MRNIIASISVDQDDASERSNDQGKKLFDPSATSLLIEQLLGVMKNHSMRFLMNQKHDQSEARFRFKILGCDFDPDNDADEDLEKIDDKTFVDHYTVG